ncbi:MAG: N-acetylmuramoyl-L-alanine amidase [Candidatus Synoicihabitans palmerolidicus]|nr:N-acetylmuramoyl-L-alanine amidase [Candidatus Synoicihabitans palmerolidicus]
MTPWHQRSTSSHEAHSSDDVDEPGNRYDAWNRLLGFEVHEALQEKLTPVDRGLKRARFAVLRLAECPAVLVEAGYLSHEEEAQKIASEPYCSEVTQAVANGVIAYANQVLTVQRSP